METFFWIENVFLLLKTETDVVSMENHVDSIFASCSIYTSKLIDIQYMRAMWKMCLIPRQMPITFCVEDFLEQE